MTPNERTLLDKLEAVCDLASDGDMDSYADITRQLPESHDPDCLRRMFHCLRDVEAGEVQYELVEALERFPKEIYVPVLISEGASVQRKSPAWFELLLRSALNSPECVREMLSHARASGMNWTPFVQTVETVVGGKPRYSQTLDALRKASIHSV